MFERTHITLTFSADLDSIPGTMHQAAEDWVQLAKSYLLTNSHYKTAVTVHTIDTIPNRFVEGKGWTPTREPAALFGYLQMEAALIVWETLNDWTLSDSALSRPEWIELREGVGSMEMRHQSIALGKWCLAIYDILTKHDRDFFDGVAYDFEVIPMMLNHAERDGVPVIYEDGLPDPANVALLIAHERLRNDFIWQCRCEANRQWSYDRLVEDHPERVDQAFELGEEPSAFVKWLGEKYDLIGLKEWTHGA